MQKFAIFLEPSKFIFLNSSYFPICFTKAAEWITQSIVFPSLSKTSSDKPKLFYQIKNHLYTYFENKI